MYWEDSVKYYNITYLISLITIYVENVFVEVIIIIFILFHRCTHGMQPQDIEHVQLHAVLIYMIQIINI
jgi:fumarate reductase subunit D